MRVSKHEQIAIDSANGSSLVCHPRIQIQLVIDIDFAQVVCCNIVQKFKLTISSSANIEG